MPALVLATKLFKPPPRPNAVPRPGLLARLTEAQERGQALILVSAPAGFGKSTLLSAWVDERARQDPKLSIAWLSLDESDSEPFRFLLYVAAALNGAEPSCGSDAMAALQSPRPPSAEAILTDLINEIDGSARNVLLVLDDFHAVHSPEIDGALAFLLEHLPARLRLVVATREDPLLPLARLRARGDLTELRAADLRFSTDEAADFLGRVMGLELMAEHVEAVENRTEGWAAGLQLAALSMRGQKDMDGFIRSFTGSHRFVLDYLGEEVLRGQPEGVQSFLLRTSILDRFCGSLCDAVLPAAAGSGQQTLEYLERANLFVMPLDSERKWYRYHRLFGELLRQRLDQGLAADRTGGGTSATALHARASEWFENNSLPLEAFRHAVAATDVDRAEHLAGSSGMPLHTRGAVTTILDWIASLPADVLDARPSLRVQAASLPLLAGSTVGVEAALEAAERSLQHADQDERTRDLLGRIAAARCTIGLARYQADAIVTQSRRALEYLHPDNLPSRLNVMFAQGYAYSLQGDRPAARRAYAELVRRAQVHGIAVYTLLGLLGLGDCHVLDNELQLAMESYQGALRSAGDHSQPITAEIHHGMGRVLYEWNDLDQAEEHAERGLQLSRLYSTEIDRFIFLELLLARIALARGRVAAAAARLDTLAATGSKPPFRHRLPEITALQVPVLLRQGRIDAAADLAWAWDLPRSRARVLLAREDPSGALAVLEPLRVQMESRGWQDEILKVRVLRSLALQAKGEEGEALGVLAEALAQAEPGGFVRTFLDEGTPMATLLSAATARGIATAYAGKLLAAHAAEEQAREGAFSRPSSPAAAALIEPLSQREREVLRLLGEGLSNQEIGDRLFIALDTVKNHNRRIFEKLEVRRRTEAIARGRELGLL